MPFQNLKMMNLHTEETDNTEDIEIQEEKRTFSISTELLEKIEQEAYWERMTNKDVLHEALNQYFEGRSLKPLPDSYKKAKRGRKPA